MQVHKTQGLLRTVPNPQRTRGDYLIDGDLLHKDGTGVESPRYAPWRRLHIWKDRQESYQRRKPRRKQRISQPCRNLELALHVHPLRPRLYDEIIFTCPKRTYSNSK